MTSMYYREIEPDSALQAFVTCYWEFIARDIPGGFYEHVVMPDGCVTIVYGRNAPEGSSFLRLVGPSLESRTVPIHTHDIFWGIRFWPGAAGCLLGLSPRALQDRVFEVPATSLRHKLCRQEGGRKDRQPRSGPRRRRCRAHRPGPATWAEDRSRRDPQAALAKPVTDSTSCPSAYSLLPNKC